MIILVLLVALIVVVIGIRNSLKRVSFPKSWGRDWSPPIPDSISLEQAFSEVFLEGVREGFSYAWKQQAEFETDRRRAHQSRRWRRVLSIALVNAVPAVGVSIWGYFQAADPTRIYVIVGVVAAVAMLLGLIFAMPRYQPESMPETLGPDRLASLKADFLNARDQRAGERAVSLMEAVKEQFNAAHTQGFSAGRTAGERVGYERGTHEAKAAGEIELEAAVDEARVSSRKEGRDEGYSDGLQEGAKAAAREHARARHAGPHENRSGSGEASARTDRHRPSQGASLADSLIAQAERENADRLIDGASANDGPDSDRVSS